MGFALYAGSLAEWTAVEKEVKGLFESIGYKYDAIWAELVEQGRVKVCPYDADYETTGKKTCKKFATSVIVNVPFVPFDMMIWMPESFYQTTTTLTLGAARLVASGLAVPLMGLLTYA